MSKSYGNTIEMFAPEKALRRQVMGIVTDSKAVDEPKDPDTSTVYAIYALLANPEERAALAEAFRRGGAGYGDVKKALHEKVLAYFGARAREAPRARGTTRHGGGHTARRRERARARDRGADERRAHGRRRRTAR